MSRTKKNKKSPGSEYWSRRPMSNRHGAPPGKVTKKLTHSKERAINREEMFGTWQEIEEERSEGERILRQYSTGNLYCRGWCATLLSFIWHYQDFFLISREEKDPKPDARYSTAIFRIRTFASDILGAEFALRLDQEIKRKTFPDIDSCMRFHVWILDYLASPNQDTSIEKFFECGEQNNKNVGE